jgi:hypothetical protein
MCRSYPAPANGQISGSMRWGNILPRDMLDNGEEDGNLMVQKDAQPGEIGNLAQVYTVAQPRFERQIKRRQSTKLPHQPPFSFGRQERGPSLSSTSTHSSTSTLEERGRFGTSCFGVSECDGVETRSRQCFASGVIIIDGIHQSLVVPWLMSRLL